ncbi:Ribulose-phosphate 3-epimerase-like [Sesbania bispinosa]|nr:Ribulose-phosphate 3-epimerase-like [Sesbania bispinosa]
MRPGVALKPGTPIGEVYPLVEVENPVEMVLVMTVEPGFGGLVIILFCSDQNMPNFNYRLMVA